LKYVRNYKSSSYANGYVKEYSPRVAGHPFNRLAMAKSVAAIQT
jgi:hypothetical protein